MNRYWGLAALLPLASLIAAVPAIGLSQEPAPTPANRENIEAALKLTRAAATEYEFRVGNGEKPLELKREPVLRWSNPDRGEVHGNIFIWTRGGRPLVIGSLYKWFTPWTHMAHEFKSLSEEPLEAKFHGKPVWKTSEAGLEFAEVPNAAPPAANDAQRLLQLKQLAKDFTATKKERDENLLVELRLLPQPIARYSAPDRGIASGGLFALVHGTDPEIVLLIEARGKDPAAIRWQYAAARLSSSELRMRHRDKQVWSVEVFPWAEVTSHKRAYTSFMLKEIPDFLKEAVDKPPLPKPTGGNP